MQRTTSGIGTAGRLPGYEAQGHLDQAWRPWVKLLDVALQATESSAWASAVPDIPGASEVALYSSPTDHARMLDVAREIGRYSLTEPKPGDDSSEPPHYGDTEHGT